MTVIDPRRLRPNALDTTGVAGVVRPRRPTCYWRTYARSVT